jgi:hypothetical protein
LILGYQKRTSKAKKNTRKNAWVQKVNKQATRAIFLAKYLLSNKPEDPSVEKLLTRMRDDDTTSSKEDSKPTTNDDSK